MSQLKNISGNVISLPTRGGNRVPADTEKRTPPRRSPRAPVNIIPDSELLEKLILQALTALKRGFYWDRGAIINLLL